jgi:hypothetical protein
MNYVRAYTPRVAIASDDQVLKGSVDWLEESTTFIDGLGRPEPGPERNLASRLSL